MVRAPCCEKMGLKRGPWTPEEDQLLIAYIHKHGHGNWRALPKLAGLLRCGKSCRLRWTNYLRPDIKRGNFTREEEDDIIKLHQLLGNRWSTIAARLPGRTDNEIKNVWHTHLKKRLIINPDTLIIKRGGGSKSKVAKSRSRSVSKILSTPENPLSPPPSSSEFSSEISIKQDDEHVNSWDTLLPQTEESLWSEVKPMEDMMEDFSSIKTERGQVEFPSSISPDHQSSIIDDGMDNMDFWYDLLTNSDELTDLPEF